MPTMMLSEKDLEQLNNEMIDWLCKIFKTQYGPNIFNMLTSIKHMIDNMEYEINRSNKN